MQVPNIVVYLGAGRGSDLDTYLAIGVQRVVLVEANPALAESLRDRARDDTRIEVVEAAVAAQKAPANLFVFNMAEMSSLREPTGLRSIFPGLRVRGKIQLETLALKPFLDGVTLRSDEVSCLVIDTPGEELDIIRELIRTKAHWSFSEIIIHCGRAALYEGGSTAQAVLAALGSVGYETELIDEVSNPDRPVWRSRKMGGTTAEATRPVEADVTHKMTVAKLKVKLKDAAAQVKVARTETRRQFERVQMLEAQLEAAQALEADMETARLALENAAAEAQDAAARAQAQAANIEAANAETRNANVRTATLSSEIDRVQAALVAAEERANKAAAEVQLLDQAATAKDRQFADRTLALEDDLKAARTALAAAEISANEAVAAVEEQARLGKEQSQQYEDRVASLDAEIMSAKAALVAAEGRARSAAAAAEEHAETLRNSVAELEKKLIVSGAELSKLREGQRHMDERSNMVEAEIARIETQIELIKDVLIREKFF